MPVGSWCHYPRENKQAIEKPLQTLYVWIQHCCFKLYTKESGCIRPMGKWLKYVGPQWCSTFNVILRNTYQTMTYRCLQCQRINITLSQKHILLSFCMHGKQLKPPLIILVHINIVTSCWTKPNLKRWWSPKKKKKCWTSIRHLDRNKTSNGCLCCIVSAGCVNVKLFAKMLAITTL